MLQINFIMICMIHKILVLLLFKENNRLLLFKKEFFFSQHIMMESPSLEEENIIKDIRNLSRLEKLKKRNN